MPSEMNWPWQEGGYVAAHSNSTKRWKSYLVNLLLYDFAICAGSSENMKLMTWVTEREVLQL